MRGHRGAGGRSVTGYITWCHQITTHRIHTLPVAVSDRVILPAQQTTSKILHWYFMYAYIYYAMIDLYFILCMPIIVLL